MKPFLKFNTGIGGKMRPVQFLLLFILPACYFVFGYLYREASGYMFLRSVDPEYAYLFNGMLVGNLKLNIQYTDHPGTPAQCFIAIVSRMVHLFRPGLLYTDDVMANSDFYLKAVMLAATIINALVLFLLGFVVQSLGRNSLTALFFQLAPFSHMLTLSISGRVIPEMLMTAIVCLWLMAIAWLLFTHNPDKIYNKLNISFGILIGLSIADKLTFLPFIIIPLIALPSWRYRLWCLITSVLSFMFFAFTIVLNFNNFKIWVRNLFMHSGRYGAGESNIVNFNEFGPNLKLLINNSPFMFYVTVGLLVVSIALFLIYRTKRSEIKIPFRIAVGIALSVMLGFMITAKHFAFHYMVPFLLLTPLMIYLIVLMLNRTLFQKSKSVWPALLLVASGAFLIISTLTDSMNEIRNINRMSDTKLKAYHNIKPYLNKKADKIIVPSYYGCSAIEYSMMFGMQTIGRYKEYLVGNVNAMFPDTYLFLPWSKSFYQWHSLVKPEDFIKSNHEYLLLVADFSDQQLNLLIDSLKVNLEGTNIKLEEVYYEPLSNEAVYNVKIN